jgi:flagellar biosynthetic protein FliP
MNFRRWITPLLLVAVAWTCLSPAAAALQAAGTTDAGSALQDVLRSASGLASTGADFEMGADGENTGRLSSAVEIAVLLTALSLLPAILISITSFTRIVIVLSFVRRALSVNELPPNPVIIGLALFLTTFVMAPVAERVYTEAWQPYQEGELEATEASEVAWAQLRTFLVANTRESELQLFADMSGYVPPEDTPENVDRELPMTVVVPAFVLSELKTAFQMGFLLFLPFLVIDLVVSSILLSMGMFMLPPVMISTPFKVLVFVLVDGWHLICQSVVTSFNTF